MSQEHLVSRRASLKSLGVAGAALAIGGPAIAAQQTESKPTGSGQDKQTLSVVDVATDRFMKGHS